ncbi:MAG: hypothetical protein EXR63_02560 [Dehalococcoidia bacterium]|nr:hypothetical protein [Dehalococcoidia bacterium]
MTLRRPWGVCARGAAASAAALLALLAACGALAPPPRNPLGASEQLATPPSTASPLPTQPATVASTAPAAITPAAAPAAAAEAAVARALEQLAEWLALPARDLALVAVEPATWPDACLGVAKPGETCAQVSTPGLRVVLRDALGGAHTLHADSGGRRTRWAGEQRARGTVTAIDTRAQRLTLDVDGHALVLRLVPGSSSPLDGGTLGRRAVVAFDPGGGDGRPPALAWLALEPGP